MIIHKIIQINGVGKFSNYVSSNFSWNGILAKNTAIYADNASGKTTFTQIIKSLQDEKGKNSLANKTTFDRSEQPVVEFLEGSTRKRKLVYSKGSWNQRIKNIEIFDAFYVENNIYVISLGQDQNSTEKISVIIGDKAISIFRELVALKKERSKEANHRRVLKRRLKDCSGEKEKEKIREQINISKQYSQTIATDIKTYEQRLNTETEKSSFIDEINNNLKLFCPDLHITKLNRKSNNLLVYCIEIKGHEIRSEKQNLSLSRTLSEGEKNALAFSFFIARLSLQRNLQDSIVVFDDPVSSLDYYRRNVTLNKLREIARKAGQFILLSHDIYFVKDFDDKVDGVLVLKIANDGKTSYFETFDVKKETMTGITKDMEVLKDFVEKKGASHYTPRDVVRCIRPILEGFLRIKYFGYLNEKLWLGDMIKLIKDSQPDSVFYDQKKNLDELEDINDYSKAYHHSNPNWLEVPLNETELEHYCKRTLGLIHKL